MARKLFFAVAALGTTLTACGPVNRGIESVNQPVVTRTDYVFDIAAPEYGGLGAAEAARLDAWFRSMGLSYGDTIYIDDPQGFGDPSRRAAVAAVAARYGLLIAPGAPVTQGQAPSGALRVVVSRSGAYVPNCPNWDRSAQPDYGNNTSSNFGCAVNANLAAMVANPEDLVRGRASNANDTIANTRALTSYRAAKPTGEQGLKSETSKGN